MAGFRKAKAEQAALKLGLYGPPGSGKTFTALLLAEGLAGLTGKRVAYIDTERGTDFYCQAVPNRAVHPDAFDFDAVYTRSITEVLSSCKGLKPEEHSVLVLDSITHLWEAAIAAYSGKQTSIGSIPMYAWGKIKKPYKELMSWMLSTPLHVIICGRQKNTYETDEETDELKMTGVTMRAAGEKPYEPHILIRMESEKPKRSNEVAKIIAYAEKDRTGVLSGRSFINPTFESLCKPLLPLLGAKQAHIGTTEESAAIDAEQIEKEDRDREVESAKQLREFKAKIDLAVDVKILKSVGKDITKEVKSKMTTNDVATLRAHYLEAEGRFSKSPPTVDDAIAAVRAGDFDAAADLARSLGERDKRFIEDEIKAAMEAT